jgi:hypothetical protein
MTFQKKRVLIVAKTYPNLSRKYDRTVCTAGIDLDSGAWIRIFPIRFFDLPYEQRPKKYDIIEIAVENKQDKFKRKESHKANDSSIKKLGNIGTDNNWHERKKILLPLIRKSVEELEQLYNQDKTSIGIIKPKRIVDFKIVPIEQCREWERELILGIQKTLFGEYESPIDKIPFKFSYIFECDDSNCKTQHDMMIEDWELCQLFRDERIKHGEKTAIAKVRQKYFNEFTTRNELYLILGTESNWNSWLIIGVFYPKKEST